MKKLGCLILCLLAFGFGQKEGKPLRSNKQLIQINETTQNFEYKVL